MKSMMLGFANKNMLNLIFLEYIPLIFSRSVKLKVDTRQKTKKKKTCSCGGTSRRLVHLNASQNFPTLRFLPFQNQLQA